MEENNDWRREPRGNMAQFHALSGEKGEEILIFTGDPEKCTSNFDDRAVEWRFPAWRGEWANMISGQEKELDWEEVLVTESGDNFLAGLSVFQQEHGWSKPCVVSWKMRTSSKGRKFKDFRVTEVVVPNLPF